MSMTGLKSTVLPRTVRHFRHDEVFVESPPVLLVLHGPKDLTVFRGLYTIGHAFIECELEAWYVDRYPTLRNFNTEIWSTVHVELFYEYRPLGIFLPALEDLVGRFRWDRTHNL